MEGNFFKIVIFFVIVVGLLIYASQKAPSLFNLNIFKGGSFNPFRASYGPPGSTGSNTGSRVSGGQASGGQLSAPPNPSSQSPTSSAGYLSNIPDNQIPAGFTRSQLSPYFKKITIASAYGSVSGFNQVRLYSALGPTERVNITGWHIRNNRGDVRIPQAVSDFHPNGFSPEADIVLLSNSTVSIYGSISPIAKNFRTNKCTGYLASTYTFDPQIPQSCPQPYERGEITQLLGICQSYILSLSSCRMPEPSFYEFISRSPQGEECRRFLNSITPTACYEKHRRDQDFFSNEWLVWTGQNPLDPQHDVARLYDAKGLLVDQYSY
ncbi:hypothetical protein HYV91_03330 [Candidatus Wolfebacteria bacterium]|nr:hypothetical protein [Candidatus Wolfebacteria bacterium]